VLCVAYPRGVNPEGSATRQSSTDTANQADAKEQTSRNDAAPQQAQQQSSVKHKVLKFLGKHKTAVKVVSRVVIVGTVISGAVDGGASEAAVPEEAAGEAALETAIDAETEGAAGEAGEAGEASEGQGQKRAITSRVSKRHNRGSGVVPTAEEGLSIVSRSL
jgi:hypothetical protein